jgi:hypothetical protein
MAEATAERFGEHPGIAEALAAKPWLFGSGRPDRDPVLNGHKGGTAPRRSATAHAAKQRVLASKNGQANFSLLRLELERQQARDRLVYARDKELFEMDELLAQARDELHAIDLQVEEQERRLEHSRSDERVLLEVLRNADANGLLAKVLPQLDYEWVDDDGVAPPS